MTIDRARFPNPIAARRGFRLLDGDWRFRLHGEDALQPTRVLDHEELPHTIRVPFCYQSELSGLKDDGYYPTVWYSRSFSVSADDLSHRVRLVFGAVDYQTAVFVNGRWVGEHTGGHSAFAFDITRHVHSGENQLKVKVVDLLEPTQPRGKQSWQAPYSCWYRGCTGIWQSVWLEFLPHQGVRDLEVQTNPSERTVEVTVQPSTADRARVRSTLKYNGSVLDTVEASANYPESTLTHRIPEVHLWNPGKPDLYDVDVEIISPDGSIDAMSTYTAFRTVGIHDGMLTINDRPVYQRLVLDQGFWPDGHYTAPNTDAFKNDIELAMQMGFNGCRKHVKAEAPQFYYWADALGYLVWSEFPSPYVLNDQVRYRVVSELGEIVSTLKQHPSIVAWTLYNESWGLPDVQADSSSQEWLRFLSRYVRQLDASRLIVDNDGWEHVESDMYGLHSYAADGESLRRDLDKMSSGESLSGGRNFMVEDHGPPPDKPLLLTEFGGIGFRTRKGQEGWSYDNIPATEGEFRHRFEDLFAAVDRDERLAGFVYTQLTDVESEINGLATATREPKFDTEWISSVVAQTGTDKES